MGSWFSNIHIQKKENITAESVADCIREIMVGRCYQPLQSAEDADAVVAILVGEDRPWISVYSDVFNHDDPDTCAAVASPISARLQTDVLGIACFDSDYMYLNLVNLPEEINAWVGIGKGTDVGIDRRTALTPWKKKVKDYPAFSAGTKQKYFCAEEFLTIAGPCLGLPMEQSAASPAYLKGMDLETETRYLYFRIREDVPNQALPRLILSRYDEKIPCFAGKQKELTLFSTGAAAYGISVYLIAPGVEDGTLTFSDVCLGRNGNLISVPLEKMQLPDGQWAYGYHDPYFPIPEGTHRRLTAQKRWNLLVERRIQLKFVPNGDPRKMLDITVALVLGQSSQAQLVWNVWQPYGSKKAFIDYHNKTWKRMRTYETDPNQLLPLLKEKDFD